MNSGMMSRRSFLAFSAMLPWAMQARAAKAVPVGLELYSVRGELKKDQQATVRAVAGMGYQCVEFYAPYYEWTESQAKEMRKLLDDLGVRCYSTHNDYGFFAKDKIQHAVALNLILGTKYMVMSSSHEGAGVDAWKKVADLLNSTDEELQQSDLHAGYHNHEPEFTATNGVRPMEILARYTKDSVALQLDVGTCLKAGADPVAWIRANPGRIRSMHCKDWSPDPNKGYSVLFGEGAADWKNIFQAAESLGGIEYYLVEQEGSRFSELETAQKCLQAFRATHTA